MHFRASDSEVGLRHHEQNREGGKAQNTQYTTGWTGLHLVSEPRIARLKVGDYDIPHRKRASRVRAL
jgi:hypothetical protein